jgi:outer membrane immunogenic protein
MRSSAVARLSALAGAALLVTSSAGAWAQTSKDSWSGFYAGINFGHASHDGAARLTGDDPNGLGAGNYVVNTFAGEPLNGGMYVPRSLSLSPDGFIGGGQVGYAFRMAPQIVLGIEADLQLASVDDHASKDGTTMAGITMGLTTRHDLEWFGTLRGRLGYLISDDLLIFGSGGLALGKMTSDAEIRHLGGTAGGASGSTSFGSCGGGQTCFAGSSSGTSTGWSLGGGFEWALTNAISLKAEYLRLDLGSDTVRMTTVAPTTGNAFVDVKVKHAYDIARMGLNVRF